jgi:hypothetical protein
MSDANRQNAGASDPSAIKDPSEWTTGDEPMTGAQESYLNTLARRAGAEAPPEDLTKAEASEKIDELRQQAGMADTTPASDPKAKRIRSTKG